jgi:P27 family predicted phage terminase small subunit
MGTLEEVDMNLIFAYCIEAAAYFNNSAYLKKVGHTFMTPTGVIVNRPEVTNARNNLANMITIGAKLGLSPVDRLKLASTQKETKPDDPFNGLL